MIKVTRSQEYLEHHGILGMKWGVKNGPPYPLDASDHNASERKAGWRKSLDKTGNESKQKPSNFLKEKYEAGDLSQEDKLAIKTDETNLNKVYNARRKYDDLKNAAKYYEREIASIKKEAASSNETNERLEWYEDDLLKVNKDIDKLEKKYGFKPESEADNVLLNAKKKFKDTDKYFKEKLGDLKYGSYEWFDERELYYESLENLKKSYEDLYIDALFKDYNFTPSSKFTRYSVSKKIQIPNISSIDPDYSSIINPVTGERDYDLEKYYKEWNEKKRIKHTDLHEKIKVTRSTDYIEHHGILGMKWGVKNGPPYPLGASDHSASERKAGWKKSLTKLPGNESKSKRTLPDDKKQALKSAAVIGASIVAAYGGYKVSKLLGKSSKSMYTVGDIFLKDVTPTLKGTISEICDPKKINPSMEANHCNQNAVVSLLRAFEGLAVHTKPGTYATGDGEVVMKIFKNVPDKFYMDLDYGWQLKSLEHTKRMFNKKHWLEEGAYGVVSSKLRGKNTSHCIAWYVKDNDYHFFDPFARTPSGPILKDDASFYFDRIFDKKTGHSFMARLDKLEINEEEFWKLFERD